MTRFDSTVNLQQLLITRNFKENEIIEKLGDAAASPFQETSLHAILIALAPFPAILKNFIEFDYMHLNHVEYKIGNEVDDPLGVISILKQLQSLVSSTKLTSQSGNDADLVKVLLYASLVKFHSYLVQDFAGFKDIMDLIKYVEIKYPVKELVDCWVFTGSCLDGVKVKWENCIKLDHHKRKVLPKENEKNILITSALPYVNNVPHLGNIIGCVLSADVYARYCRLRGYNTLYICGTDEYGTATETKAIQDGVTCQELCDKYHELHKQSYDWFQIDFDHFGRTTTPQQTKIAQDIYSRLNENGHIMEDTITQLYCEQHQSFLADRFVEGTCPLCQYEDARGDQCDGCGKLLNAIELINPRCKLDGAKPIPRDSKHLFLNLTEQQPALESWFKKASVDGAWSSNSENITSSWLKEGLQPRCITRDLKWGTKVPRKGYENKVFYVWFDAPIGYPSITATYTPDWEKWWKNPDNVNLYQFMGKDNVPFHTVIFPSTLIGTNEKWTLLHHLSTTEYLQYESGKFSKSRGVGVFGNNVVDSGIPVDTWRYYLLSNRPETSDSQFTWKSFAQANNAELLANVGNFINRVVKFTSAKYESLVPAAKLTEAENILINDVNILLASYVNTLENVKIRRGIQIVMEVSSRGNQYLQENKIDNSLFTNQRERCDTVVSTALNLCYLISSIIYPYLPSTSASILRQLNLPQRKITDTWSASDILPGHVIGAAEYLFKRIEDEKVAECQRLYSGQNTSEKLTASDDKKKKKNSSKGKSNPVSAPAALPETLTPEMQAIQDKITSQGLVVRRLKSEKAEAGTIKQAVDLLLALKKELAEASK